jgi:hypothetical protein
MVVKVCKHDMKIKFSKFQDLICVVKTRITSKGDWTLHHLIGSLKMLMLAKYNVYDGKRFQSENGCQLDKNFNNTFKIIMIDLSVCL